LSYEKSNKNVTKDAPFQYKTKYLGGTSIFPKYSDQERKAKIVELDHSCIKHKQEFTEKLENAWHETLKVTQPYRFDPLTN
jgi:hypothetical protein